MLSFSFGKPDQAIRCSAAILIISNREVPLFEQQITFMNNDLFCRGRSPCLPKTSNISAYQGTHREVPLQKNEI